MRSRLGVAIVTFPTDRASGRSRRPHADDRERAFGLYLDKRWAPTWPADVIVWPDVGLPANLTSQRDRSPMRFYEHAEASLSKLVAWEGAAGRARC